MQPIQSTNHFMWPKLIFPFALANILKLKFVPKKNLVSVINLTVIALTSLYGLFSQCRHMTFPRELPSSFHNLWELMHLLSIKFRGKCSLGYHHVVCIGKNEIFKQMRSILIINYILKREIAQFSNHIGSNYRIQGHSFQAHASQSEGCEEPDITITAFVIQ